MIQSYSKKLVVSGDIVEYYQYENPIVEGYTNEHLDKKKLGRSVVASDEDKKINRDKVMNRAKRDLRRLINSNIHKYGYPSKFLTLTFSDDVKDVELANYEFKKFIKRLNYEMGIKTLYSTVIEFQDKNDRGVVHYHTVLYNVPYIPQRRLSDIWKNGFVWINKIDQVDNVGAYVTKYMSKDNDDERLVGKKCYFNSRGLLKPKEFKNDEEIKSVGSTLNLDCIEPIYSNTFENEHNKVLYRQYNPKRDK